MGIGNPIMSDDGVGLALLLELQKFFGRGHQTWIPSEVQGFEQAPPMRLGVDDGADDVEFVDGGTSGMELLPVVGGAQKLLVLDAVAPMEPGQGPGTVMVVEGDQVPRLLQAKLSPHQVSFLDLLAACRLLGQEPGEIVVVGVVPESTELDVGLTGVVEAAVPQAAAAARRVIEGWLAAPV